MNYQQQYHQMHKVHQQMTHLDHNKEKLEGGTLAKHWEKADIHG